jgi:hypothetical protein
LTINTIPIPTFPANSTAAALQQLLVSSLKALVAVEKTVAVEAGGIVFRLLTNRTAFPDDLAVTAALVVLPDINGSSGSGSSGSGSSSTEAAEDYTCLRKTTAARNFSYTNVDGSTKNMIVYDEVWENVTVGMTVSNVSTTETSSSNGSTSSNSSSVITSFNILPEGGVAGATPATPPALSGVAPEPSPPSLQETVLSGGHHTPLKRLLPLTDALSCRLLLVQY